MFDEQQWERQENEPNLWYDRFVTYLRMGPARSLLGAANVEQVQKGSGRFNGTPQAWLEAFRSWNWKERAESYDEYRRKKVFTEGNAYDVNRVERLNHYSQKLEHELDKMFNSLPKRMKKPWFNYFLFDKYLQTMDALAQETGGRVKTTKQEVTGKEGGPVEYEIELVGNSPDDDEKET